MAHYLIIDGQGTCAREVEQLTGCKAHDTHLGILVEGRKPIDVQATLARLERALHPSRCICGKFAVIHRPECPESGAIT